MRRDHSFSIVCGEDVRLILDRNHSRILEAVAEAYQLHHLGDTISPDSSFLRFHGEDQRRIIALPAYLGGRYNIAGIKWISSVPENLLQNLPRASACLLLNNARTGRPFACLEGAHISAARTAASAVIAAFHLNQCVRQAPCLSIIGSGVIGRSIADAFFTTGWSFERVCCFDVSVDASEKLFAYLTSTHGKSAGQFTVANSLNNALASPGIVVFATTAPSPYVKSAALFSHDVIILNISLRDISPEIILDSFNILDDVEHCLKADTSPHLAEKLSGGRNFVHGTIASLITGESTLPPNGRRIFSPFGLGVLDLAVGKIVFDIAMQSHRALVIDYFHP